MRLTEILNSEDLILVDTSIRPDNQDFSWRIYEDKYYTQLDRQLSKEKFLELENFIESLEQANVYTIKAVTKETEKLERILDDKIKFCSSRPLPKDRRKREETKRRNKKPKNLLYDLQKKVYELRTLLRNKEINRSQEFKNINNSKYNSLLEMTKLIEKRARLKKDIGYILGAHERDQSEDSDTDEKLVASLYWLSLFSNKNPCLLSGDADFIRLLWVVTRLIGSDYFLPYNENFRQKIIENPFKLYSKNIKTGEYELAIESSKIKYDNRFLIGNISPKSNLKTRRQISRIWKEFVAD